MFTVTKEDFTNLHNAKYQLSTAIGQLQETLSPTLVQQLDKGLSLFKAGMENIYMQERTDFDRKNKMYDQIGRLNNFRSVWSIYSVADMEQTAPGLDTCTTLKHDNNFEKDVAVPLKAGSKTWFDLWQAADKAIRESGDLHHLFIEGFVKIDDNTVRLVTGS